LLAFRSPLFLLGPGFRCDQLAVARVELGVAQTVFKVLKVLFCSFQLGWLVLCELPVLVARLVVVRNAFLQLLPLVGAALGLKLVCKFVSGERSLSFFIAFPFVLA